MAECRVPHPLRSSPENTNGAKLSRLIVDGGTTACRRLLKDHYPTAVSLASALANHRGTFQRLLNQKKVHSFKQKQWDQLFPPSGCLPDIESFDITLLVFVMRNICPNLPAPLQGWDRDPPPSDTSQSANLLRIKNFRNEVAHASKTGISSADFEARWNAIAAVLVALGMDGSEIDRLKVSPLDEEKYLKILFDWGEQERNIKQRLQKIAADQEEEGRMLEKIAQNTHTILKQVQDSKIEKRFGNILYKSDENSMIGKQGPKGTRVYRGKLASNGQDVAVKKIFVGLSDWNKAYALRELKHPNVVRCFAAEEAEDFIYIALELCDKTLVEFLEGGDFAREKLSRRSCLVHVAEAIKYLHEQGWCHRDIKPGNVLVTDGGDASCPRRFLLADANISKETHNETFSTKKPVAGDIGWIANEVYQPGFTASPNSDIFSLGCTFYYTLTNMKHPFGDGNNLEDCQKSIQCGREAVLITGDFVELPNLERLIKVMVAHFPDKRPTAAIVCDKLQQVVN